LNGETISSIRIMIVFVTCRINTNKITVNLSYQ